MRQNVCHPFAPSMPAASMQSWEMFSIPAMKRIRFCPKYFQPHTRMIDQKATFLSVSQEILLIPNFPRMLLNRPYVVEYIQSHT